VSGRDTFGPSALATPANALTMARLLATPVIIVMVVLWGPSWAAFLLALAVAASDGVDGWIARRQGTTRSGAFLDPLADKAVVLGVLVVLAVQDRVGWIPVVIIAAREIAMQAYRSVLGRRGVSVPARPSAKVKTLVQDAAVCLLLLPPVAPHRVLTDVVLWIATLLTVVTGIQYLLDARRASAAAGPFPEPGRDDRSASEASRRMRIGDA
jgi:CDP-diacylglycerol---glycerol-3-phosphate 3-phosphatidyltransferase